MPFEPIRFIHASNLRLDSPMQGIGYCADDMRHAVETATMTAFERVMDACIAERVDFLLLTGNSFDEGDQSLPARIALLDGFERLNRQGVRVFVLPGPLDPAIAWRAITEVPNNVTTFFDSASEAVAVLRDGKVIASVTCTETNGNDSTDEAEFTTPTETSTSRGPIRVGLCLAKDQIESGRPNAAWRSFDYVAIGGSDRRETLRADWGIVHSPGSTQAINNDRGGPHGCTLVEVAADGTLECHLISTAAIRMENLSLSLDPQSSQSDLIARMRQQLDERAKQLTESHWLVNWAIAGSGQLFEQLCDDESSARFIQRADEELRDTDRPPLRLSVQVVPDRAAVGDVVQTHSWTKEYFDALDSNIPLTRESLVDCLSEIPSHSEDLGEQLAAIVSNVDDRIILGRARQFGIEQFRQTGH